MAATMLTPATALSSAACCRSWLLHAGVSGMAEFSAYSASKHALVGLMRSAAAEYAPKGIRINCINPATTGEPALALRSQTRNQARHGLSSESRAWSGRQGGEGTDMVL